MARKVITSKPVNPSAWLLLRQKIRNAIIHATREEVHAKHDRDTKRMELERLSKAIFGFSPGFRHEAHTLRKERSLTQLRPHHGSGKSPCDGLQLSYVLK